MLSIKKKWTLDIKTTFPFHSKSSAPSEFYGFLDRIGLTNYQQ